MPKGETAMACFLSLSLLENQTRQQGQQWQYQHRQQQNQQQWKKWQQQYRSDKKLPHTHGTLLVYFNVSREIYFEGKEESGNGRGGVFFAVFVWLMFLALYFYCRSAFCFCTTALGGFFFLPSPNGSVGEGVFCRGECKKGHHPRIDGGLPHLGMAGFGAWGKGRGGDWLTTESPSDAQGSKGVYMKKRERNKTREFRQKMFCYTFVFGYTL
jgi:hypothetical protein